MHTFLPWRPHKYPLIAPANIQQPKLNYNQEFFKQFYKFSEQSDPFCVLVSLNLIGLFLVLKLSNHPDFLKTWFLDLRFLCNQAMEVYPHFLNQLTELSDGGWCNRPLIYTRFGGLLED